MFLYKKTLPLPSSGNPIKVKIHDYSSIIDISIYKGGYDQLYFNLFYSTSIESDNFDKIVNILVVNQDDFINTNVTHNVKKLELNKEFKFFKSFEIKFNHTITYFIFLHEELSISENRNLKIENIIKQ